MKNDVGPAASTSRAKLSLMPRTTDDSATTTKTPTATPMIVSSARTLFARIDSIARDTPSSASTIRFMSRIALLLSQRFDRVEQRGATRRVHAGDDSDDESQERRGDERPGRYRRRKERELPGQCLCDRDAERDPDDGAEGAQGRRLDEELSQDVAASRT